jgi:hypothetical protein
MVEISSGNCRGATGFARIEVFHPKLTPESHGQFSGSGQANGSLSGIQAIGQTDFASSVNTTDRTLRAFRKTGKVRRDILEAIAKKMNITKEELLKPE